MYLVFVAVVAVMVSSLLTKTTSGGVILAARRVERHSDAAYMQTVNTAESPAGCRACPMMREHAVTLPEGVRQAVSKNSFSIERAAQTYQLRLVQKPYIAMEDTLCAKW